MSYVLRGYQIPQGLAGTILEEIVQVKMRELACAKKKFPAAAIRLSLERVPKARSLTTALRNRPVAVIAEIKKASPSAGVLREDFLPFGIAAEYEAAGATAISVVTEVQYFRGGLEVLASLRWRTKLPLLRKDFLVDPYQILEARHAGADAVLLIAALIETARMREMREQAEELGMDALVEVHDERELNVALESGATLVGVNNRDLRTFHCSLEVARGLAPRIPGSVVGVAESGIRTPEDVRNLSSVGYRGFLVGEQLLRADSPGAELGRLIGGVDR